MPDITIEQTKRLKEIVLLYLQGEKLRDINFRLHAECNEAKTSCKSLYKSISLEDIKDDPFIINILNSLNIKKSPTPAIQGPYEKLLESENLYELLKNLCHDGHHHVDYLLQQIENTNPKTNWAIIFILGAISSAGLGIFIYIYQAYIQTMIDKFIRTFPSFVNWVKLSCLSMRNIPLLGMIYTGLILSWHWYNAMTHGTTTTTEKINSLFFQTLAAAFTISGYILTYLAAGAITTSAAILLVLSSSVEVVQSVFNWFKSGAALQALVKPDANSDIEIIAQYERTKSFHQRDRKTVWIKMSAAVLITLAAVIWNFFPPNLIITIFCVAFISLVGLAKMSIEASVEEIYANELQETLKNIHTQPNAQKAPTPHETLRLLAQKEQDLNRLEQDLTERENNLQRNKSMLAWGNMQATGTTDRNTTKLSSPAKVFMSLRPKESTEEIEIASLTQRISLPESPKNIASANDDIISQDRIEALPRSMSCNF